MNARTAVDREDLPSDPIGIFGLIFRVLFSQRRDNNIYNILNFTFLFHKVL